MSRFHNIPFHGYISSRKIYKQWRKQNPHNNTFPYLQFPKKTPFPIDRVSVGMHSYGELHVHHYNPQDAEAFLRIGNFVSIARDVHFYLNENHATRAFSTFPLSTILCHRGRMEDAHGNGPIIVEDDVWIGAQSIIFSGVIIGRSSIIGAGSVVRKSVPPFSIVQGNPASVVKKRFSEEIIEILSKIDLASIPIEKIEDNIDLLYSQIDTLEDARRIYNALISQRP